jgi:hypothetical protein
LPGCAGFLFDPAPINPKEKRMRKVLLSLVAAVAMGAGFTMTSANAAPVSPSALQPSIIDTGLTEDVQWRRCWHRWRSSRVVCRYWRGRHYWRWSRRW